MTKNYHIRVHGRVQGVMFRRTAADKAASFGIRGFVRNEPGGAVFIKAEGDEPALERYLAWCKKGPTLARVEHVEVEEGSVEKFLNFTIVA